MINILKNVSISQAVRVTLPVSCVVEEVDRVHTNGQGVEENPPTDQVEKVVTHILIYWNPVCEKMREREES